MPIHCFGPFRFDRSRRLLERAGEPVAIGGRSLDLLIALIDHAGHIVSTRALLAMICPGAVLEDARLRTTLSALRKALGDGRDGARYIVNVTGRGYTFVAAVETVSERQPVGFDRRNRVPRTRDFPQAPDLPAGRPDAVFYRPVTDGSVRSHIRGRWYRLDHGRAGGCQW